MCAPRTFQYIILLLSLPLTLGVAITVTVAPVLPTSEPQYTSDPAFTSAILNSTNTYRAQHNATSLTWNDTLASFADDYLSSADCIFEHSDGPYGENLAMGYRNVTAAVEAWGEERREYKFKKGRFSEKTGHFTQLVWKSTEGVGCGRRFCGDDDDEEGKGSKGWLVACEYWPRGNVEGKYGEEVLPAASGVKAGLKSGVKERLHWGLMWVFFVGWAALDAPR